jgi:hypothetical protein
MFSKCIKGVPEPAKTELTSLSSFQQMHVDGLCGVIQNFSEKGTELEQHNVLRELEFILEIMGSYSSFGSNGPSIERSKSSHPMTPPSPSPPTYSSTTLVAPSLSEISGRLSQTNTPEVSSGRDHEFATMGCVSLILVKIKKIEVDIELSNSNIHPSVLSMTNVLRDGRICSFYHFLAHFSQ